MDIEKLAREAGLQPPETYHGDESLDYPWMADAADLRRFAALVVEECAKVAKGAHLLPNDQGDFGNGWCCASFQIEQALRILSKQVQFQVPPASDVSAR